MGTEVQNRKQIGWKQIAVDASRALAHIDADRLDELAQSCQALNRDLPLALQDNRDAVLREARQASSAIATFALVLDATRANLQVLYRLREVQAGGPDYGSGQTRPWAAQECSNGHN